MKKLLHDATNAELIAAAQALGLDARLGQQTAYLITMLQTAHPGMTEIEVQDTKPPATVSTPAARQDPELPEDRMVGSSFREDPKVLIVIPASDKPGGKEPVQVGVNGVAFLIKRNEPVEVPYRVFEVLDNSKQTDYVQEDGPTPTSPKVMRAYTAHGYAFSVLRPANPVELARFQERTAAHFAP